MREEEDADNGGSQWAQKTWRTKGRIEGVNGLAPETPAADPQ